MKKYILIACMGFVGALLRTALSLLIPETNFPVATLTANVIGCFLLEITYDFLGRQLTLPSNLISGMGVGLLGSFTTMSTFSNECLSLFATGAILQGCIYCTVTACTCLAATFIGHFVSRLMGERRLRQSLTSRPSQEEQ
ncbi:MAG: CrcB family protein [Eggerthellaceae bacterium]|nr:CrcB family protein [Eggerthellaceae bacterium]MCH4220900.1 CrcB family protein [Eggerthellaceae bacterium]